MKRLMLFLPLLMLFACSDDDGGNNEPDRPKPEELYFDHIEVQELSPSVERDAAAVSLKLEGSAEELFKDRFSIAEGKFYTRMKLRFPEADQTFIAGVKDTGGDYITAKGFNVWERVKNTEYNEDGIQFITIDNGDFRFKIKVSLYY